MKRPTKARIVAARQLVVSLAAVCTDKALVDKFNVMGMTLDWCAGLSTGEYFETALLTFASVSEEAGGFRSGSGKKIDLAKALATGKYPK